MRQASARKLLGKLATIDAACKKLYGQRDEVETKLIEAIRAAKHGRLPLGEGRSAIVKDNFVDPRTGQPRNTAFKTTAIKRFEVVTEFDAGGGA
jgi:hypothetical protein